MFRPALCPALVRFLFKTQIWTRAPPAELWSFSEDREVNENELRSTTPILVDSFSRRTRAARGSGKRNNTVAFEARRSGAGIYRRGAVALLRSKEPVGAGRNLDGDQI